jgi:adenine-specific DNA-methyltransferase
MTRRRKTSTAENKPIEQYTHTDKDRVNIPPVGLVTPDTDKDGDKQTYQYDPHLDPHLQWTSKAERTSFEVPTVSLHVHERIDPRTIIEAVRKKEEQLQPSLFAQTELPLRQAIEFYKHRQNWTNRLIAGDSTLVMNSLLVKEGMAGQVQMIYFDPPYGIKYGSNFQPFVNKREVKDGKDEDLTQEPETLKAFRDTWELGIHSYLTYLRDRLLLARVLLHESGSIFVQISDDNVHFVRNLMDEVFGVKNAMPQIVFRKTTGAGSPSGYVESVPQTFDYLVWYTKDRAQAKFRRLYLPRSVQEDQNLRWIETADGERRRMTAEEVASQSLLPVGARPFRPNPITSQTGAESTTFEFEFNGLKYKPKKGGWKTNLAGMKNLLAVKRLMVVGNTLCFTRYLDDFPYRPVIDIWDDTRTSGFGDEKVYVVQTNPKVIQRCLLMTTDPGDLVFDPTCGSGTTAVVAEQWGRRWITCDTSRVAVTLAKQRLMTANFDYYNLAKLQEGVSSGFRYKTVPHITLKSIANNEPPPTETLYDQPLVDSSKQRVTGPFTVESVPAPTVQAMQDVESAATEADASIARSGETLRQSELRDELLKTGIRGRAGERVMFSRVESLSGTQFLHADAEILLPPPPPIAANARLTASSALSSIGVSGSRAVVSFGPEHHPLGSIQVARALEEANRLFPKPKFIIFAAFQFDPEAAQDIEQTNWPGVMLLKAEINKDLQTQDLKKKRSSNESFWLIGQPDAQLREAGKGDKGEPLYQVEVLGFDYYDTKEGKIISGSADHIAVWMLDTDYDGRSIFPRQVFFPMAGDKEGWSKLAKNLKAQIDEDLIEAYRGKVSLPFAAGENRRAAVKIVDDRGIESIKLIDLQ